MDRIAILAERNQKLTEAADLMKQAIANVRTCQNHALSQTDINNLGLIVDRLVEARKIALEERI
jgi:hypothetical protein